MFDFGNDDKEKLRENMEQIKELVDKGETLSQDPSNEEFRPVSESEDLDGSFDSVDEEGDEQETQVSSFGSEPETVEEDYEEDIEDFEEKFSKQEAQQPPQETSQDAESLPESGQSRSRTTRSGIKDSRDLEQLSDEVPSPPKTREINVPEIDRGPLFLRQQKFLKASQMIEDMLYLSDSIERTVNDLEAGIQEDQEVEREAREILLELESNRTDVEDIISPREQ